MTFSPVLFDRHNVLVTGGAGFIGSHLCDTLVKDANVICLDNFSTSTVANIEHLLQNPHFEFINHDIIQPFSLESYPELERFHLPLQGVQEIYHLACPISRKYFENYRIAMILTNSVGMKHVLDCAVAYRAKLLFASSSALYGPRLPQRPNVSETDPCLFDHLTPSGAYDEGKRFSEAIVYTYADVYKLDVKISRIFRTYGPRMKLFDGNLLPDMVNAALEGRELQIAGDEHMKISLCYVSDIVDGLMRHMQASVDVRMVNLGSDHEYSLPSLAKTILQLASSSSSARFIGEVSGSLANDPGLPNISKAREVLHWLPLMRLEDGLRRMMDDAKSRRQQTAIFQ